MAQYPKILGLLGLGSEKEALTETHMQAAEEKITQLEQGKVDAESKLATTEASLKTAQDEQAKTAQDLKAAKEKVATLQEWKDNQASVDNREEDDTNKLEGGAEALAPWEKAASSAIDTAKKRVGKK
jgi:chromosome segregation ATPase